jgi:hypothetical protein
MKISQPTQLAVDQWQQPGERLLVIVRTQAGQYAGNVVSSWPSQSTFSHDTDFAA